MPTTALINQKKSPAKTILLAWIVAGTLDILAAIISFYVQQGKEPSPMLRFIASGVMGKDAFTGGTTTALYGLALHYLIALLWTVVLFMAYHAIYRIIQSKVTIGLLYGIVVWVVMNHVILPMSNTPPIPFQLTQALIGAGILMLCVGLPVSLIVHRYYFPKRTH
ncbi:MAG TPA: hypothetical protein VD996_01455 [Chitinophagaceae bacterium]|nr:hypothetical protein [Chitinophagaceae bacterium]